jgi:hypothetical protein
MTKQLICADSDTDIDVRRQNFVTSEPLNSISLEQGIQREYLLLRVKLRFKNYIFNFFSSVQDELNWDISRISSSEVSSKLDSDSEGSLNELPNLQVRIKDADNQFVN